MMISIIAAIGQGNVIGNGADIPWHLPADFAYFKKITTGHPVIMGANTFASIGRPLPGRINIILTKHAKAIDGCVVATSLDEAIEITKTSDGGDEVFIIGGAFVYEQTIDLADRLYITYVEGDFNGDKFFPKIDIKKWKEISRQRQEPDATNEHSMDFVVFNRAIT